MQSILDQFVYFGFFQSVLLIVIFLISLTKRKQINEFLFILIVMLSIGLLGKVVYNLGLFNGNFRLIAMSEFSALLFGPTIFLFVRSVLFKENLTVRRSVHYIPGVIYSLFILGYFILPSNAFQMERNKTIGLMPVIYVCHSIGLVVNSWYWWYAYKSYQKFSKSYKEVMSFVPHILFVKNFLVITGFCMFIWVLLFSINFLGFPMLEREARPYIWLLLTFIILFISYYMMLTPDVLQAIPTVKEKKYNQSKLSTKDLDQLKLTLEKIMTDKKPYLNAKLLKTELAQMLGVNSPELSRLLNENIGMNFFEYVNYYRIKEFVNLAQSQKGKQLTFFGLAQEAGFNSKTTFNKSFKSLMGVSPSAYFNQQKHS